MCIRDSTGKGRCNITNAGDMDTLFANVMTNPKFLYSAFYDYDNQRVIDFFEENGLATKVERGNRVFPVSDHSSDVIKALEKEMRRLGVVICLNTKVKSLIIEKNICKGVELVNKKEKVVKKARSGYAVDEFICLNCGNRFR